MMGVESAERRPCRLGGQERREGPLNPAVSEDNLAEESGSWAAGERGAGCRRLSRRAPGSQVKCRAPHPGVWALRGAGSLPAGTVRVLSTRGGSTFPHGGVRGALPRFPRNPTFHFEAWTEPWAGQMVILGGAGRPVGLFPSAV